MNQTNIKIGKREFVREGKTLVMGILNATPDSFSDGGFYESPDKALKIAETMIGEGAQIIDIGGESTRPGATEVQPGEEWRRVGEIVKLITNLEIPVSIDTYKAEIAKKSLEAGAEIVNDVWGLQRDPAMAETVAEFKAAVVIMHNRNEPLQDEHLIADIQRYFENSLEVARKAGIRQDGIILDPGIGFGKNFSQNGMILRHLTEFKHFGYPILVGLSRKRFIGNILGLDEPTKRIYGTIGANIIAVANGANIIRVHDVKAHVEAVRVADDILARGEN